MVTSIANGRKSRMKLVILEIRGAFGQSSELVANALRTGWGSTDIRVSRSQARGLGE